MLPEYPRPQLMRAEWLNLNGWWDFAVGPRRSSPPLAERILVPFCVESSLSGIERRVGPDEELSYGRSFELPHAWRGRRVLLHFGAVDWECHVWVNGVAVGSHQGGYDPFWFDVTSALVDGIQQLAVTVWDPTDAGPQPRGKQVAHPHGIYYTPVSGIWQTVWLEPVPEIFIERVEILPRLDQVELRVQAAGAGVWEAEACGQRVSGPVGESLVLELGAVERWTPDAPHLHDLRVRLGEDEVQSYFALREVSVVDRHIVLNGEPCFGHGLLDQGYWPDGLYTAPSDEALRYDLEVTKQLGFNLVRKHVKVEPARWYAHCDRIGLLVWQDMPSGGETFPFNEQGDHDGTEQQRPEPEQQIFRREWQAIVDSLRNHPCIVAWVCFNEAWGQFDTAAITRWTQQLDPTRLVNSASGGNDFGVGDLHDIHRYPGPALPAADHRAAVCGEYGGLGMPVRGHCWAPGVEFVYVNYPTLGEFQAAFEGLQAQLPTLIAQGLCAAVYTQTTDVESEVNGLLTYDREICKLQPNFR